MEIIKVYFDFFMVLVRQQMEGASVVVFLMSCIISVLLLIALLACIEKITKRTISVNKKRALILMVVYACFIFQIAFYRRFGTEKSMINTRIYFGLRRYDGTVDEKQVVYSFLNVLFFIPWGVLISSAMDNNFRRIIMTCIYSFLTSLTIEVMQYITQTGVTEVTDLVTNVTGGMIGCVIYILIMTLYKKARGIKEGVQ